MEEITNEHIGRRVVYTGRNGNTRLGTIIEVAGKFVNLKLNGNSRQNFYVPMDTIKFVPEALLPETSSE